MSDLKSKPLIVLAKPRLELNLGVSAFHDSEWNDVVTPLHGFAHSALNFPMKRDKGACVPCGGLSFVDPTGWSFSNGNKAPSCARMRSKRNLLEPDRPNFRIASSSFAEKFPILSESVCK